MMNRAWTHRVVKVMRGKDGSFFDYPTAGTFGDAAAAGEYAEAFALEQTIAGVTSGRVEVRARKGGAVVALYRFGQP